MFAVAAASGAVDISDVQATNVGTTSFTMVWTTSEVSTPGLVVFSDSGGVSSITSTLGLDYYPIASGNPAVVNDRSARDGRRVLELLSINRQVVSVRVTGLTPGTSYYVRPRTFGVGGIDNGSSVVPLKQVTTALFTSFPVDARLVRVRFPAFTPTGMIALVQGPAGTMPLSSIIGDSAPADSAMFPLANVLDTATGTSALYAAPQSIVIRVLGAGAPVGTFTKSIAFGAVFNVAAYELIDADLSSPSPFFTTHPQDRTAQQGTNTTFTVVATGTPAPSYKWQRRQAGGAWSDLVASATYVGVTSATLTVNGLTLAMTGDQFRNMATNGVPPDATSDAATLTVLSVVAPPLITAQPQSVAVAPGQNASFTFAASGTPAPNYKWQSKPAGGNLWSDLANGSTYSGVTTATLLVSGPTLVMTGDQFRAIAFNGVGPDATSDGAVLTVSSAPVAPAITTQPLSTGVIAGLNATFTVGATGSPVPTYKWQYLPAAGGGWSDLANGPIYSGVNSSVLQVIGTTVGMTGDQFRAIASNGIPPDATSNAATLTVNSGSNAPLFTAQPQSVTVAAGQNTSFTVAASGAPAPNYKWQYKPAGTVTWSDLTNGAVYSGVTTATLSITGTTLAMTGDQFRSIAANGVPPDATSNAATLTVTSVGASATHVVIGGGYSAGGTVTVAAQFTYVGAATSLSWQVVLPAGWSFAASSGDTGSIKPVLGTTGLLQWSWASIQASPIAFTYTLNVPAGTTGDKQLAALVSLVQSGATIPLLGLPDPLIVRDFTGRHSADTSGDFRIGLLELTRVIELYNTRNGTTRTGCYSLEGGSEDGFAPDPTRASATIVTLPVYHSADSSRDGKLSLLELTRVIELYNYRNGTTRTGQYHAQLGTEDGFAPGP